MELQACLSPTFSILQNVCLKATYESLFSPYSCEMWITNTTISQIVCLRLCVIYKQAPGSVLGYICFNAWVLSLCCFCSQNNSDNRGDLDRSSNDRPGRCNLHAVPQSRSLLCLNFWDQRMLCKFLQLPRRHPMFWWAKLLWWLQ